MMHAAKALGMTMIDIFKDKKLREETQHELKSLQKKVGSALSNRCGKKPKTMNEKRNRKDYTFKPMEQKELDMLKQKFGMSNEQVEMIAEQVRVENQEKEEKAQLEKNKE